MLISKLDLYKTEWLELVFDDRNKAYGAYELRQHNGRTMMTAMLIAFTVISVPFIIMAILFKPIVTPVPPPTMIPVPLINIVHPPVVHPPKPLTHHAATPAAVPSTPSAVHRFVPPVVAPDPIATEPPKVTDLANGAIGPVDVKGPAGPPATAPGPPETTVPGNGNAPVLPIGLERMPEPYGGASAWAKFLQKHLKYPDMAVDARMQGKVFVSFIVEKDGHLSNITVDRGIGYGLDEEALRVLKLAPAWMPGIQNGQPVRVKYNIPINFKLGDDND